MPVQLSSNLKSHFFLVSNYVTVAGIDNRHSPNKNQDGAGSTQQILRNG